MADSYTCFWTFDQCRRLERAGQVGASLDLLLGGPHLSQPSFLRAGVQPGDWVYPVRVQNGVLFVIARMRVRQIYSAEEYIEKNNQLFGEYIVPGIPSETLRAYFSAHPARSYLVNTCASEVITGEGSSTIRLDRPVPPGLLENIRYRSQRRERGIKHIVDGKITRVVSLHGIYRLSPASARVLSDLVDAIEQPEPNISVKKRSDF